LIDRDVGADVLPHAAPYAFLWRTANELTGSVRESE
jgi:hypothetical protein